MPPSVSGASSSSEALGAFRCRRIFLQPRPPAASTILSVRGARPDTSRGPSWPWPGPWSTTIRRRPYGDLSSAHSSLRRERPFALSLPAARTCGRLTRTGSCGPRCSASPSSTRFAGRPVARASSSARIARPLWRSAEPLSPTRPLTRGTGASAVTRSVATARRTLEPFDCCDRALRPPLGAMPAATPSPPPGRPRASEESCEAHEHEYPTRIDLGRQRPSRGAGAPPEVTVLGARRDEERATIRLHGHPDRLGADVLVRLMPLLDSHGGRVVLLGPPGLLPAKLRRTGTGKPRLLCNRLPAGSGGNPAAPRAGGCSVRSITARLRAH